MYIEYSFEKYKTEFVGTLYRKQYRQIELAFKWNTLFVFSQEVSQMSLRRCRRRERERERDGCKQRERHKMEKENGVLQ